MPDLLEEFQNPPPAPPAPDWIKYAGFRRPARRRHTFRDWWYWHGDFVVLGASLLGLAALVLGIAMALGEAEDAGLQDFKDRCVAAGETPAKCDLYVELKRSADDAALAASAAAVGSFANLGARR